MAQSEDKHGSGNTYGSWWAHDLLAESVGRVRPTTALKSR